MNLNHKTTYAAGDQLTATAWNNLAADVNEIGANIGNGGGTSGGSSSEYVALSLKGNVEVTSPKHVNIEPAYQTYDESNQTWSGTAGDIQLKPGDDVSISSEHRGTKSDEVSIKILDGSDNPVKLQIQAGEIVLQAKNRNKTKAKDATTGVDSEGTADSDYMYKDDQAGVFDINVTKEYKTQHGAGSKVSGKGYLKVRAQAIDLRCEDNGGIALQPKGNDGGGFENKIKFEHNGGDGLEFGTFNTQKTSIFTDEYRFNENGVVYAVTRGVPTTQSYKDDGVTPKKIDYPTQSDDFKDILDATKSCTWNDIIVAVNYIKSQQPSLGWTPATNA